VIHFPHTSPHGKTTIALHRVSYFLYTLRDIFHPYEMLILAPNRLFIDYMKEVLPELGVDQSRSTTFEDFVQLVTGHGFEVQTQHETLMSALEVNKNEDVLNIAELKGSPQFEAILDRYIYQIKKEFIVEEDFMVAGFRIVNGKRIKQMFLEDYAYLPFYKRKEKIRQILMSDMRRKKKVMLEKITKRYDDELDKALYGIKDPDKRKRRVSFLLDQKEQKLQQIETESKKGVRTYMKKFPNRSLVYYFKRLYQEKDTFNTVFLDVEEDHREIIQTHTLRQIRKKKVDAEDLATLLYLQAVLYGVDKDYKAKKVVIDEAQDYSYMEFVSLKMSLDTELFTIVGDLAQGIYRYRGLKHWQPLLDNVFKAPNYLTLQKTYRTTIDIMNVANQLLSYMDEDLPQAEPVVRRGEKPSFHQLKDDENWGQGLYDQYLQLKEEGFQSFVIIGKTIKECHSIYEQLEPYFSQDIQFIDDHEDMEKDKAVVLPVYLSKGLEFDCVFLIGLNDEYEQKELDMKLLYVAMSRPLHRLSFWGDSPSTFLLDIGDREKYK